MKVGTKIIIGLFTFLLVMSITYAVEPTQQFNKIFLDPFYRVDMNQDQDYNYTITIDPPDGFGDVVSAIVTFQLWLNPTIEFFLEVDGQTCNTASYEVHTTYAGAGEGTIYFDCSNIINKKGDYTITLQPDDDTGAITGWLDLVYMNKPKGDIDVKGTEYRFGEQAKTFLQLLDADKMPVSDASCFMSVYNPDTTKLYNQTLMAYVDEGLYQLDLQAPNKTGVYMLSAYCSVPFSVTTNVTDDFECNGFNCNPTEWNSAWVGVDAACDIITASSPRGTYHLEGQRGDEEINCDTYRPFDNSDYSGSAGYLTFWAKADVLETGDDCNYYYWDGSSYNLLLNLDENDDDDTYRFYSYEVNLAYGTSATARIRFQTSITEDAIDECYIDDINYYVTISDNTTEYQFVRGSGEIHINDWFENASGLVAAEVWNYNNRTLTEAVDLSNISVSLIADDVWDYPNRTLSTFDFDLTNLINMSKIAENIWSWDGLVSDNLLTYFNRTIDIWSYVTRTLTAFDYDIVDESLIADYVWNATDRNLTYYETFPINVTDVVDNVWNYSARYTHGEVLS